MVLRIIFHFFTLEDIIRAEAFLLQSFAGQCFNPSNQLTNANDLNVLLSGSLAAFAQSIQADLTSLTSDIIGAQPIVPDELCSNGVCANENKKNDLGVKKYIRSRLLQNDDPELSTYGEFSKDAAQSLQEIDDVQVAFGASRLGSNGEVIAGCKSASGNALWRYAPQPTFNQPSDGFQINFDSPANNLRANISFLSPTIFVGGGVFNDFGMGFEVGSNISNDYLFENSGNILNSPGISPRQETILIAGQPALIITVFRSSSQGWVFKRPNDGTPPTYLSNVTLPQNQMLTLRSV